MRYKRIQQEICRAVIMVVAVLSAPPGWAERLPTADEVTRIRAEQPLPSQEALGAVKGKNSDDTAQALEQAQRQQQGRTPTGIALPQGLPAIGKGEGVNIQSLVEKHYQSQRDTLEGRQKSTPGLLYFASFSLPDATLDRTVAQADRSGAALVVRGLVKGGDFRVTLERMDKVLKGRKVSILIDPTLFTRFEIQHVPTVVLVAGGEAGRCDDQVCATPAPPHWAVAGDVSLEYALEAIVRLAPEAEAAARPYLTALRGGFHEGR